MSFGGWVEWRRASRRSVRHGRHLVAVIVMALLVAACTTSGQASSVPVDERPGAMGAGLTLASLGTAPKTSCPLTNLPAAVTAAGLTSEGSTRGTVESINPEIRMTGFAADCTIDVSDGGSVSVLLIAGQNGSAVLVLAPQLQHDADLSLASLQTILDTAGGQRSGDLVNIPGDAAVAVRLVLVDGAFTAALLVSGEKGPTRSQVEAVAGALAHR